MSAQSGSTRQILDMPTTLDSDNVSTCGFFTQNNGVLEGSGICSILPAGTQLLFQQVNQQKLSALSLTRLRMSFNCLYKFFAVAPIFLKKVLLFNFA